MSQTVQVIVNADDLGATPMVNDVIFELMGKGKVTSATIIANSPCVEDAWQRLGNHVSCSFGVHLNITEFQPLTDGSGLHQLLDDDGGFAGYDCVRDANRDSELKQGVLSEFLAQIERCQSAGVEISHIDSHHHVHTIPWIFPILKKVQKQFDIRRVRISKNIYSPRDPISTKLRIKKIAYNTLLRNYFRTSTTGAFCDFQTFYEYASSRLLGHKKIEVMVHPGLIEYEGSVEETELLRTSWESQLKFPVELISFNDLDSR